MLKKLTDNDAMQHTSIDVYGYVKARTKMLGKWGLLERTSRGTPGT